MLIDLTGKWHYQERYDFGRVVGVMNLTQTWGKLQGEIIFTDKAYDGRVAMIREKVIGMLEERKMSLRAIECDVIDTSAAIDYMLDSWFGIVPHGEDVIVGMSLDYQGAEGLFTFKRA
jgi:hypothetical protein